MIVIELLLFEPNFFCKLLLMILFEHCKGFKIFFSTTVGNCYHNKLLRIQKVFITLKLSRNKCFYCFLTFFYFFFIFYFDDKCQFFQKFKRMCFLLDLQIYINLQFLNIIAFDTFFYKVHNVSLAYTFKARCGLLVE